MPTLAWDATTMAADGRDEVHEQDAAAERLHREPRRLARRHRSAEAPRRHRRSRRQAPRARARRDRRRRHGRLPSRELLERAAERLRGSRSRELRPRWQRKDRARARKTDGQDLGHVLHAEERDADERLSGRHRAARSVELARVRVPPRQHALQERLDGRRDRQRHVRRARARSAVPDRHAQLVGGRAGREIRRARRARRSGERIVQRLDGSLRHAPQHRRAARSTSSSRARHRAAREGAPLEPGSLRASNGRERAEDRSRARRVRRRLARRHRRRGRRGDRAEARRVDAQRRGRRHRERARRSFTGHLVQPERAAA